MLGSGPAPGSVPVPGSVLRFEARLDNLVLLGRHGPRGGGAGGVWRAVDAGTCSTNRRLRSEEVAFRVEDYVGEKVSEEVLRTLRIAG